ncbi:hypothetical protein Hanom_Chr17g01538791 [Helianthus anomalus]
MKKEFGDCTRRLSLCFLFSNSAGGFSRSTSFGKTCIFQKIDCISQQSLQDNSISVCLIHIMI